MYGLCDCNNFFVSCERVFRPDLADRPVVVLSNNDGCIIAHSNEAKALGIGMGQPFYPGAAAHRPCAGRGVLGQPHALRRHVAPRHGDAPHARARYGDLLHRRGVLRPARRRGAARRIRPSYRPHHPPQHGHPRLDRHRPDEDAGENRLESSPNAIPASTDAATCTAGRTSRRCSRPFRCATSGASAAATAKCSTAWASGRPCNSCDCPGMGACPDGRHGAPYVERVAGRGVHRLRADAAPEAAADYRIEELSQGDLRTGAAGAYRRGVRLHVRREVAASGRYAAKSAATSTPTVTATTGRSVMETGLMTLPEPTSSTLENRPLRAGGPCGRFTVAATATRRPGSSSPKYSRPRRRRLRSSLRPMHKSISV